MVLNILMFVFIVALTASCFYYIKTGEEIRENVRALDELNREYKEMVKKFKEYREESKKNLKDFLDKYENYKKEIEHETNNQQISKSKK